MQQNPTVSHNFYSLFSVLSSNMFWGFYLFSVNKHCILKNQTLCIGSLNIGKLSRVTIAEGR